MITEKQIIEIIKSYSTYTDRSRSDECVHEINFNLIAKDVVKKLTIPVVSNRYFVFRGQEDSKPTKYLVDDCKDMETAIAKIETEYPNFKWVMTEAFNGC